MQNSHLAQVGVIKPILDDLSAKGVNVHPLLKKSQLDKFNLHSLENYVPLHFVYDFFHLVKTKVGIDNFLQEFGSLIHLVSVSQWGELICTNPDVLSAINMTVDFDEILMTNEQLLFEINGTSSKYICNYTDFNQNGREQMLNLFMAFLIDSFKLAAGENWYPKELFLPLNQLPDLDQLLPQNYKTIVYLNQPYLAVTFDTSLLSKPFLNNQIDFESSFYPGMNKTFKSRITNILDGCNEDNIPNLNMIAEYSNVSTRSLQRSLQNENTTYFKILDEWRLKTTIRMLENPSYMIKQIAFRLGYSKPENFIRAFKRWTKVTPEVYRDMLIN